MSGPASNTRSRGMEIFVEGSGDEREVDESGIASKTRHEESVLNQSSASLRYDRVLMHLASGFLAEGKSYGLTALDLMKFVTEERDRQDEKERQKLETQRQEKERERAIRMEEMRHEKEMGTNYNASASGL